MSGICEIDASKPGEETKRILYMCSDCNYICGMLRSMRTHKRTCTGEKGPAGKGGKIEALKKKMYVCSDCDFSTTTVSSLYLHECKGKISTGCQTDFDKSTTNTPLVVVARPCSNVEDQDASAGKSKETVACQTDPVKFERGKDERIDCPHCSYSTTSKHNMGLHLKTHTGEKPHACTYCGKRFSLKSNVTTHERIHTGQRPFKCDTCNKSFASKSVCDRHRIRWHTEERPFVCEICFMGFKFRPDLRNHKKTHNFG